MQTSLKLMLPIGALVAATAIAAAGPARAGSLDNMERERAQLIEAMLDAEATPADRQVRMETARRRLIDLERMVLRDEGLVGRNTPNVRRAFANYDLTFLVHASAEKNLTVADTWLEQLGISTQSLLAAKAGRR
ncbi:MAG: hypothetical protein QF578_12700 [Alphaproteobacteria bacterium]|nr:hypothetical protein [Alphaproteobacteria bacterium]